MKALLLITSLLISYVSLGQKSIEVAEVFYQNHWRYIDKKGDFLFDQVPVDVCYSAGMVAVKQGGKVGFTDFQGKLLIPYQYDHARCFQGGFAAVVSNGKMGMIDRAGKFIVKPQYELIGSFDEQGLAGVLHKGKLGFVDTTGKFVIPFKYEWHPSFNTTPRYSFFSYGLIAVMIRQKDGTPKIGFINRKGELAIPAKYDNTFMLPLFFDGKTTVFQNKNAILIDTLGKEIFRTSSKPGYNFGFSFYESLSNTYGANGKLGLINEQGQVILEPTYLQINPFKEGLASVTFKNSNNVVVYSFINKEGKRAFEQTFAHAKYFSEGLVAAAKDNKWGYVDRTGQWVIRPQFERADDFYKGLAAVAIKKGGQVKYGFIDKQGKFVIAPQYEEVKWFRLGLAPVKLGGKFGYINRQGKMVIPPKYDNANAFFVEKVGE